MTHHAGDTISFVAGCATALVVHVADLVSASGVAGEVLSTLVFGFLGGVAGYLGRLTIDQLKNRKNQSKN